MEAPKRRNFLVHPLHPYSTQEYSKKLKEMGIAK
jgi:hypothetical protein